MERLETAGVVAMGMGAAAAAFAGFGLAIVCLQHFTLTVMPVDPTPDGVSFTESLHAFHSVWLVHMPVWILGGVLLASAGWAYNKHRRYSSPLIRTLCVLGSLELAGYAVHTYIVVFPRWKPLFAKMMPVFGSKFDAFMIASMAVSCLTAVVPMVVLFVSAKALAKPCS